MKLKCSECGGEKEAAIIPESQRKLLIAGLSGKCGDCLRKSNTASRHRSNHPQGIGQGGAWRGESNARLFLPGR